MLASLALPASAFSSLSGTHCDNDGQIGTNDNDANDNSDRVIDKDEDRDREVNANRDGNSKGINIAFMKREDGVLPDTVCPVLSGTHSDALHVIPPPFSLTPPQLECSPRSPRCSNLSTMVSSPTTVTSYYSSSSSSSSSYHPSSSSNSSSSSSSTGHTSHSHTAHTTHTNTSHNSSYNNLYPLYSFPSSSSSYPYPSSSSTSTQNARSKVLNSLLFGHSYDSYDEHYSHSKGPALRTNTGSSNGQKGQLRSAVSAGHICDESTILQHIAQHTSSPSPPSPLPPSSSSSSSLPPFHHNRTSSLRPLSLPLPMRNPSNCVSNNDRLSVVENGRGIEGGRVERQYIQKDSVAVHRRPSHESLGYLQIEVEVGRVTPINDVEEEERGYVQIDHTLLPKTHSFTTCKSDPNSSYNSANTGSSNSYNHSYHHVSFDENVTDSFLALNYDETDMFMAMTATLTMVSENTT